MPAKSEAQFKYMAACAYNRAKMKGKCPPKEVAKEFTKEGKPSNLPYKKAASRAVRGKKK